MEDRRELKTRQWIILLYVVLMDVRDGDDPGCIIKED